MNIQYYLPYIDPFATEDDLVEVRYINDYELYVRFRDGRKYIFDTTNHGTRGFYPDGHILTDEELERSFCDRLYNLMRQKRINQNELALRINTTQAMISRYMTGQCVPSVIVAAKIARALDCSIEDLLYKEY